MPLFFGLLYAKCPYFVVLYMQSALINWCFICKVSLLFGALYAWCPYSLVFFMQSVLVIWCFICKASLLFGALYAKCPYCVVLYMQRVLIIALPAVLVKQVVSGKTLSLSVVARGLVPTSPRQPSYPHISCSIRVFTQNTLVCFSF